MSQEGFSRCQVLGMKLETKLEIYRNVREFSDIFMFFHVFSQVCDFSAIFYDFQSKILFSFSWNVFKFLARFSPFLSDSALDKTISGPVSNHHRHHGNYPENHERFRERDKHESLSTNTYDNGDGVAYYGASTSNSKGNSNTSSSNNNENNNVTLNTTVHSAFEKSRFQTESVPYQFDPGSNRDRSTAVGH